MRQCLYHGLRWWRVCQHGSQPQARDLELAWGEHDRRVFPWSLITRELFGRNAHAPADTYHRDSPSPRSVRFGSCPEVCLLEIDVDSFLVFEEAPRGAKQNVAWHAVGVLVARVLN